MNEDIVKGKWKEIKGKFRKKWAEFTEDEISQMKGSEEELEGALQKKYGYKKDEARKHLRDFLDENAQEDE